MYILFNCPLDSVKSTVFYTGVVLPTMDAVIKFQRASAVTRTTTTHTAKLFKCILYLCEYLSSRLTESLLTALNLVLMMIC